MIGKTFAVHMACPVGVGEGGVKGGKAGARAVQHFVAPRIERVPAALLSIQSWFMDPCGLCSSLAVCSSFCLQRLPTSQCNPWARFFCPSMNFHSLPLKDGGYRPSILCRVPEVQEEVQVLHRQGKGYIRQQPWQPSSVVPNLI